MVFCSRCGTEYVHNAKFCHKCGKEAAQTVSINDDSSAAVSTGSLTRAGTSTSQSTGSGSSRLTTAGTLTSQSTGSGSSRLSFSAYRMRKEQERSSCSPLTKKSKKTPSKNTAVDVRINVGIMTLRDGRLLPKRNTTLPLNVNDLIGSKELLDKAVEKHSRFNSNLISNNPSMYRLLYGNIARVQEANTIPGSEEPFSLRRYKEEIGKPYSKISFYICPFTDFLGDLANSSSSSDEEMSNKPFKIDPESSRNESTTASDYTKEENQSSSVEELTIISPDPTHSQTVQCPICLDNFNVEEVQHHAEECSAWLLNEDDDTEVKDFYNEHAVAEKEDQMKISDMGKNQVKKMLKEEVSQVSNMSLKQEGPKRVTVRRKRIWEDFKDEVFQRNIISPSSKIKVVFSGEPAVDDGGPRRELFSGIYILYCPFHNNIYLYWQNTLENSP